MTSLVQLNSEEMLAENSICANEFLWALYKSANIECIYTDTSRPLRNYSCFPFRFSAGHKPNFLNVILMTFSVRVHFKLLLQDLICTAAFPLTIVLI